MKENIIALFTLTLLAGCAFGPKFKSVEPFLSFPEETLIQDLRPVARGGKNSQPRWSNDGKSLLFRHFGKLSNCEQIYSSRLDGTQLKRVSTGRGRATDARFLPGDERILFSSTLAKSPACPIKQLAEVGGSWTFQTSQIYSVSTDGTDLTPSEAGASDAYNGQLAVCENGTAIFTSSRSGDFELYSARAEPNGTLSGVQRITRATGFDGGAAFSKDCKKIVWSASRPSPGLQQFEYLEQVKSGNFKPTALELWIANADGTAAKALSSLGVLSYAPVFGPSDSRVVFTSNLRDPSARQFDLYEIDVDGVAVSQLTFSQSVDAFGEFSPDYKHIAFSSNRKSGSADDLAIFVGEWDPPRKSRIAAPTVVRGPPLLHSSQFISALRKAPLPL